MLVLYITDFWNDRILEKAKQKDLSHVGEKLKENKEQLVNLSTLLHSHIAPFKSVMQTALSNKGQINLHRDSIYAFLDRSEGFFSYQHHIIVTEDSIKLSDDLELNGI